MSPLIIAVVNLKGGTTKTTTSAFFLHALHEAELTPLGVDADGENQHLMRWRDDADWPVSVISMPTSSLHKDLPGVMGQRFGAAVIDTPPMTAQRGTVMSALRIATHVVVPMAPTPIEYERVPAVREAIEQSADLRPSGKPPIMAVLLNRCVSGAASTGAYRQQLTEDGLVVLQADVARLERFSQAYGDPIKGASNSAFGDAVVQLLDMEEV